MSWLPEYVAACAKLNVCLFQINKLERNFNVSNVIFKKYQPIFVFLFKDPSRDPPKQNRSRKQK